MHIFIMRMRHVIKQHSMHIFIMRMWHVITQHNMHARPRSVYLGAKIDLRGLEGVFRRKLDVELKLATLIRRALGPYQRRKTNTHTHTHTQEACGPVKQRALRDCMRASTVGRRDVVCVGERAYR
jgi:hypothetical protein